jgi:hypothetical protein
MAVACTVTYLSRSEKSVVLFKLLIISCLLRFVFTIFSLLYNFVFD